MPIDIIEMIADYGIESEAPDLPAVSGAAVVKAYRKACEEWMRQTDGEPWKVDPTAMTIRDYIAHFAVVAKKMKLTPDDTDPKAGEKLAALMLCVADSFWFELQQALREVIGPGRWDKPMKRAARRLLGLDPDATAEELVDGKPVAKPTKLRDLLDAPPPPPPPVKKRQTLRDRIQRGG